MTIRHSRVGTTFSLKITLEFFEYRLEFLDQINAKSIYKLKQRKNIWNSNSN